MVDFGSLNKRHLLYTVCIYLNHFAFGVTSNIVWSALTDLTIIYNASSEAMSYFMTYGSLGYLIGSLSGYLYKWINRQMTIVLLCTILAVTIALVPQYPKLWILFTAMVFNGIGGGTWDSNNNVWLVEMWPDWNAPVIQASQFMYGLGTIFGPLIVAPYVHGENGNTTNTTWPSEERKELLTMPFAVTGVIQIVIPAVFFVMFFVMRYRGPKEEQQSQNDNEQQNGIASERPILDEKPRLQVPNRKTKLVLVALGLAMYDAAEIAYFYFSPTVLNLMDPDLISAEDAAHIASILSAAYTAGRLATAFISIKLKPDVIIGYHFVIIIVGQLVLYLGRYNRSVIIGGTVILGYGFSAMWPAIIAFTDRYLKLTNRAGTLLFFFAGVISLFTPLVMGRFLNNTPTVLFLFEGVYIAVALALFIMVRIMIGFVEPNGRGFSIFN